MLESLKRVHHEKNNIIGAFVAKESEFGTVEAQDILHDIQQAEQKLQVIDARGAARYRGEIEPLDPVAGHIPTAINRPFEQNLNSDGTFKSPEILKSEWIEFLKGHEQQKLVHQCGSGISACHNIFSMYYAGLGATTLYQDHGVNGAKILIIQWFRIKFKT